MSKSLWSVAIMLLEDGGYSLHASVVEAVSKYEAIGKAYSAIIRLYPAAQIWTNAIPVEDEYIITDPAQTIIINED